MATGEMRLWGWGEDSRAPEANEHLIGWLAGPLGSLGPAAAPVAPAKADCAPSRLSEKELRRLAKVAGPEAVSTGRHDRLLHAAGKGYPDLVRMRAGRPRHLPDAVVRPAGAQEAAAVLDLCARRGIAVVPFGGGTSVVGGVEPLRGDHATVVSLDTGRMRSVLEIDPVSRLARLEAGLRGPEAEFALQAHGLTLGHFPQSFEYSTVGGWAATRSAGQASSGYGRIDDLVRGLRMVCPAGELSPAAQPASAAGPDLRELAVGSEGSLGLITDVTLEVSPRPAETRYEAFLFPGFPEGVHALRELVQAGAQADVTRLSDEEETAFYLAAAGLDGVRKGLLGRYLKARGGALEGAALAIMGWEGPSGSIAGRRAAAAAVLKIGGAVGIGTGPGQAWARGRFEGPYLRDELMARAVMVETLETATSWENADRLYREVGDALRREAPVVGCHVSHVYPTGCCLYFTFLAPQDPADPIGQWERVKKRACEAIVGAGGTITHHHGIGIDHRRYLRDEDGRLGVAMIRAAKSAADPASIMNPGKLVRD